MPSTPRMIQIEAKASQPGEPLTQAEVTTWHVLAGHYPAGGCAVPYDHMRDLYTSAPLPDYRMFPAEAHKAIRYLDSTGWRATPKTNGPI